MSDKKNKKINTSVKLAIAAGTGLVAKKLYDQYRASKGENVKEDDNTKLRRTNDLYAVMRGYMQ